MAVPLGGPEYGSRTAAEQVQQVMPTQVSPEPTEEEALAEFEPENLGLGDPSARPQEPITAGVPIGAGRNDLSLRPPPQPTYDPDILLLVPHLPLLELLASEPGVSAHFRNFVRLARAKVPPEFRYEDLF